LKSLTRFVSIFSPPSLALKPFEISILFLFLPH
jgi:hypothetical protein